MTTPLRCRTFAGGEFRTEKETFERRNPATDEVVAIADLADAAAVDAAVAAAVAAFASWGRTTGFERGRLLRELAQVALGRLDDLATSMTLEMGKPLDEARGEVRKFAQAMRFYAEEAERIGGETIPNESDEFLSVVRKEPVGPVAAITPWNYPVELVGWKLGGALGAGCTMVVKPSEYTPGAAQILAECIAAAGFPPGVVNVVHGAGEVGALLAGHRDIAKIAFTGSNATGQRLFKTVDGVTRLTLELGGSCPMLVSRHADLDLRRGRGGPPLVPQRRADLHRDQPDLRRAPGAGRVRRPRRGAGLGAHRRRRLRDPGADVGPVDDGGDPRAHRGARRRRRERGATVATGAEPHAAGGPVREPRGRRRRAARRADHDRGDVRAGRRRHARRLAGRGRRSTPTPCRAAWPPTSSPRSWARRMQVSAALDFGNVAVNNVDAGIINAPYGGRRESGFGSEHGREGSRATCSSSTSASATRTDRRPRRRSSHMLHRHRPRHLDLQDHRRRS